MSEHTHKTTEEGLCFCYALGELSGLEQVKDIILKLQKEAGTLTSYSSEEEGGYEAGLNHVLHEVEKKAKEKADVR